MRDGSGKMEFERLSKKYKDGNIKVVMGNEEYSPGAFFAHKDVLDWIAKAAIRLAEYEELGSPEQIRKIIAIIYDKDKDDLMCKCGHPYYRHFDSYEDMEFVVCKYCGCRDFKEKDD